MKLTRWITRSVFFALALSLFAFGSHQSLSFQANHTSQPSLNLLADDGGTSGKPTGG